MYREKYFDLLKFYYISPYLVGQFDFFGKQTVVW